jgi:hypothetical protein
LVVVAAATAAHHQASYRTFRSRLLSHHVPSQSKAPRAQTPACRPFRPQGCQIDRCRNSHTTRVYTVLRGESLVSSLVAQSGKPCKCQLN